MRVIEQRVYKFNELSDKAKERARAWWREVTEFEYGYVIDDIKTIGDCLGIDIDKVLFSGFSSIGDGACFVGDYSYKAGWRKELAKTVPYENDLFDIGAYLQNVQKQHTYRLTAKCENCGVYCNSAYMAVYVAHKDDKDVGRAEDELAKALREFADWAYRLLESEYDHQMEDDTIDENIVSNEYEFTEDGKFFKG